MPTNIKDIGVRSLSGFGYVGILLGAIYSGELAVVIVISLFSGLALWEFLRLCKTSPWLSLVLLIVFFALGYLRLIPNFVKDSLLGLALVTNLFLCFVLFSQKTMKITAQRGAYFSIAYVMASSYFILEIGRNPDGGGTPLLVHFYLTTWANNSFAYLVGSAIGKNKLLPTISPKKSWEGFLGGVLATVVVAILFSQYTSVTPKLSITLGLSIPILATVGDLIQSYFKRKANVKDSGSLLPGHGGFYDRMDSVIFSAPFYYIILIVSNYVS